MRKQDKFSSEIVFCYIQFLIEMNESDEIYQEYEWLSTSLEKVIDVLKILLSLSKKADDESLLEGVAIWVKTPKYTQHWKGIHELRSKLIKKPDQISVNDNESTWRLDLDFQIGLMSVRANITEANLEFARTVFGKINNIDRDVIKIIPPQPQRLSKTIPFKISSKDSDWIGNIIKIILQSFPSNYIFYGSYQVISEARENITYNCLQLWLNGLTSRWKQIVSFDAKFSRKIGAREVGLFGDIRNSSLEVEITDDNSVKIEDFFDDLIKSLELEPIVETSVSITEKRDYFINTELNYDWLNNLMAISRKYAIKKFIEGSYTLPDSKIVHNKKIKVEQTFRYKDILTWKNSLQNNWSNIIGFSINFQYLPSWIDLHCDPKREFVTLRLETRSNADSISILSDFENELNLTLAPDIPWNFRMVGNYEINKWSVTEFIRSLENAIEYNVGSKYRTFEAYVIQQQANKDFDVRKNFLSVNELILYLKDEKNSFTGVGFWIEGVRGKGLGVHVKDNCQNLLLKSTLDRRDYPQLRDCFSELKLGQAKETNTATRDSKGWHESFLGKTIIAALGVIGTALLGFMSWETKKNITPSYTLYISQPTKNDEIRRIPKGTQIYVKWDFKKEKFLTTKDEDSSKFTVTVYQPGGDVLEKCDEKLLGECDKNDTMSFDAKNPRIYLSKLSSPDLLDESYDIEVSVIKGEGKNQITVTKQVTVDFNAKPSNNTEDAPSNNINEIIFRGFD